jgi:mRNA-degrading endonuclease RelE of RelBE toxin-antitoxin system
MKTKVEISDQVLNFLRSLAPEPRRSIRLALRGLEDDRGDIKQLEGDLADWCRLRVTTYRVIFRYETEGNRRIARPLCLRRAPRVGL